MTGREARNRYVKHFGPQWFASTMGIGALGIALGLVANFIGSSSLLTAAQSVTLVTLSLTLVFLVPWSLRLLRYPDEIEKDMSHPIRSQFFPTMPITLLVVGVALQRTLAGTAPDSLLNPVSLLLFGLGTAGILYFGLRLTAILFTNTNIETKHGVFAWYIPPVSHLLIPVLGFVLIQNGVSESLGVSQSVLDRTLFVVSLAAMGIGFFTFLFLTPVILHRYAYEDLPDVKLAPTFLIGIAPTSILVIDLANLIHVLEATRIFGFDVEAIEPLLSIAIVLMWGFSAWWLLLTVGMVLHYVRKESHGFEFTWWAYTFPLGAFTISTGVTAKTLGSTTLYYVMTGLTGLLVLVVVVVAAFTTRLVKRGEAFVPE
ncbi:C4-dicarboxylate transporter [Halorutilales archaeon Cl-col2-1]